MIQTEETTVIRSRQPLTAAELRHHLIKIESGFGDKKVVSDYLPVQGRVLWFHGEVSRYKIKTEKIVLDFTTPFTKDKWTKVDGKSTKIAVTENGVSTFKATVIIYDPATGEILIEVDAHKTETKVDFPDFQEKSETGAVGRALALAGYGTKFALELREDERVVDSPIAAHSNGHTGNGTGKNLSSDIAQTKKRAAALQVARNADEWAALLAHLQLPAIQSVADISKINDHLSEVEKKEPIRK